MSHELLVTIAISLFLSIKYILRLKINLNKFIPVFFYVSIGLLHRQSAYDQRFSIETKSNQNGLLSVRRLSHQIIYCFIRSTLIKQNESQSL